MTLLLEKKIRRMRRKPRVFNWDGVFKEDLGWIYDWKIKRRPCFLTIFFFNIKKELEFGIRCWLWTTFLKIHVEIVTVISAKRFVGISVDTSNGLLKKNFKRKCTIQIEISFYYNNIQLLSLFQGTWEYLHEISRMSHYNYVSRSSV